MTDFLKNNLQYVQGVGPKRAAVLKSELGISTVEDILYYFPYKYVDRTKFYAAREVNSKLPYVQLKGKIQDFKTIGHGRQKRLVAKFVDSSGSLDLVWFKGIKWIQATIEPNKDYLVYGKPSLFGRSVNMVHPDIELNDVKGTQKIEATMQAFYPTSEKMKSSFINSKAITKIQAVILKEVKGKLTETLPAYLLQEHHLLNINEALLNIHFPQSSDLLRKAQYRLKFEELFYIQLNILKQREKKKVSYKGHVFSKIGFYFNEFYEKSIPFELTGAQKKVLKEIRRDLGSGRQMNRLLQGDVGSGKTLVALMSMLIALDNACQACMIAPTEILAIQHFETLQEFLQEIDIQVALLTGSSKKKDREVIHESLKDGSLQILVGTHALLEDVVQFQNLGIMIIDEQHRFGVAQRAKLWRKNYIPPHVLVMSATPIPRTLAMTVYGDLDVSIIDELPPGRKEIKTLHVFENKRNNMYNFVKKELKAGRQVYIVYPMIKESEKFDYENLEDGFMKLLEIFPPENYTMSMVHGKMKAADKEEEMHKFVNGKSQILVATTVIEVGVNVPNASVMIIENAERFGLSQLHQLRGRVGRGASQSYCILVSSYKLSREGRTRLEVMVRTTDGFEIAEADMKLRGPGDIEGTQQSGIPFDLKIANLVLDTELMQYVRDIATVILQEDENLSRDQNFVLQKQLKKISKGKIDWSTIS